MHISQHASHWLRKACKAMFRRGEACCSWTVSFLMHIVFKPSAEMLRIEDFLYWRVRVPNGAIEGLLRKEMDACCNAKKIAAQLSFKISKASCRSAMQDQGLFTRHVDECAPSRPSRTTFARNGSRLCRSSALFRLPFMMLDAKRSAG